MRTLTTFAVLAIAAVPAGQAAQAPNVPVNVYAGYAFADCSGTASVVRIVLPAGKTPIPSAVPGSPPRPAVELAVHAPLDRLVGGPLDVVAEPPAAGTPGVVAASCPVVGSCSRARTGTLSLQKQAEDGALTGEFRMRWPDEAARQTDIIGKFTARWLASDAACK